MKMEIKNENVYENGNARILREKKHGNTEYSDAWGRISKVWKIVVKKIGKWKIENTKRKQDMK